MGYSFYEKEYLDQEKPEGKQVELRWFADKKMDTYTRFVIEMGFLITGLKKAEIERGGVKTSANKGSLEMRITAYVERDYDGKWSKTPLMKQMRRFYDKYIVRERHDKLEAEIMGEAHQLIDEIRAFLGMHKFEPI